VWLLGVSGKTKQEVRAKLKALHQELNSGVNLDHFEGLTRCLGALSALALERDAPHLAARLIGTAAAVRDRFGVQALAIRNPGRTSRHPAGSGAAARQRVHRATGRRP
jgi:hypothetical protein